MNEYIVELGRQVNSQLQYGVISAMTHLHRVLWGPLVRLGGGVGVRIINGSSSEHVPSQLNPPE